MGAAPRVVVFSLQKSGTHLIQELIRSFDYWIVGQSRLTPEDQPQLMREDREYLARELRGHMRTLAWKLSRRFDSATDDLWEDMLWSWQARLGTPMGNRYDHQLVERALHGRDAEKLLGMPFASTPANVCWMLHDGDIDRIDGRFLREWAETGRPPLIFNYRDPRDVLVSFVNYLCNKTGRGFGRFNEFQVFSRTLLALPTAKARLLYAIEDPSFPGHKAFRQGIWLLRHPAVWKVRFEDLVGPEGGGTARAQHRAVRSVMEHLEIVGDPESHARKLFRRDAFTFFRGQIGSWRDAFDRDVVEAFKTEFGEIVETYGYSWSRESVTANGRKELVHGYMAR